MSVFAISFAAYTLAIVAIGIYSARFSKNSDEDYFLAGRKLGPWMAALSASASSESGWVTIGLVGMAFRQGFVAYWIIPGVLFGFIFNWFVVAGRMRDRSAELGALTIPDFFSLHFKERLPILRIISVIVILIAMWLYVAAQFSAAGAAFSAAFIDMDYKVGVVLGASIVLIYTVIGGFRAACWTDFAQSLLMVGVLVIFPIYLLLNHGGFDYVHEQFAAIDAARTTADAPSMLAFWPEKTGAALIGFLLGSGALGINFGFPGQPHVLVRFMALRSRKDAMIGGFIAVTWAAMIIWGAITIGLIVRALSQGSMEWTGELTAQLAAGSDNAGDQALVLAAKNLIPGVLSGVVLAAVLAAICSTADSQLVVAASAGTNDVYARLIDRSGKKSHPIINRVVVFGLGIAAMLLVMGESKSIFGFVLDYGWAILGASFGPQLILILLWKRATYAGCVAGMATGFSVALLWKMLDLESVIEGVKIYNLTLAFISALIVNVIVSLLTRSK
ncbi:MAG: sodium/proline symporter [Planctomycetes bacterium]|nr:sodium/proline symporter [Planctomycetota bacterium]